MLRFLIVVALSTWTVCTAHGNRIPVCGNCEFTSIQQALAGSQPHDTLLIHDGHYKEGRLPIDKPLTIIGINQPVIDGEGEHEIFTVVADSVTIEGLILRNVGISYIKDQAAINLQGDYCIIRNNEIMNGFFGIFFRHSEHGIIENNRIVGSAQTEASSGNAIHLWYCDDITVKNNIVSGHRDGIYFEFVDNSNITDNTSENNLRYGLHFMFSNHDTYRNNVFRNNGAGVAVMYSKYIYMYGNYFEKNWGSSSYGILLKEIYDGEIINNIFLENTTAIFGETAVRIVFEKNDFIRNGVALKLYSSCMDNTIIHNNFISNTFDMSTNATKNYNDFTGNYWSEYTGYDLDRDGYGDIPYRPVKLFSYVTGRVPESIVLLRSLFVDIINFAEMITPVFTPETLMDPKPLMERVDD